MSGEIVTTIVGSLTADPELRFTAGGAAVANLTIASNSRRFDKSTDGWVDDPPLFMSCSIWRDQAENVVESLTKGTRVIAVGRLKQRSYDDRDGVKRTVVEMELDEIGPSLKFATAKVTRAAKSGGYGGSDRGQSNGRQSVAASSVPTDPWGSAAAASAGNSYDEEPPF